MSPLRLPLTVGANGSLTTLVDGSAAEIGQSVEVLLSTRVGERRSEPTYGSHDVLFGPRGAAAVDTAAIAAWEPRATPDIVELTITDTTPES